MAPAVLANLVGRIDVEAISSPQLLHQLATQLNVTVVSVARLVEFAQPLVSA
jgi:hypothetical protein